MEITTALGLIVCLALVVVGIFWGGGTLGIFLDASSVAITFGGSFASLFMAYSMRDLSNFGKVFWSAFKNNRNDPINGINTIVGLANVARKEGMLSLEENVSGLDDVFLQKGIMLIVDGTDQELVKNIMESELTSMEGRHANGRSMFDFLATAGPAFGMLGTLIGLVIMLKNLSDPDAIGSGMAAALITTLYGSVLANCFAIPLANKLKVISSGEIMYKEILLEGILSIQAGENPRIIEEKLYSFLPNIAKAKVKKPPVAGDFLPMVGEDD